MKNKSVSLKFTVIIIFSLLLNLGLLFYLKYSVHHLSISDFSLAKIGNIFNISFYLITILGLITLYFRKTNIPNGIVYLLVGLLYVFLLSVVFINFTKIPSKEYFLLSLSFVQVLIISAFGLYQFSLLFLMLFVWLKIFYADKLIYLRSAVNGVFISAGLLVFTVLFINTRPLPTSSGESKKANVAVVLGAAVWADNKPSPSLAFRVDKAAELYKEGNVNKVQLTGGNAPGELSEAEVSLNHILKKGISREDIWIEKNTTSTIEQIRFIRNNLITQKHINSVIIVSDIYHLQRVREICRFYNVQADVAASDLNLKTDKIIFYQLRECVALLLFWLFGL